jgi:HK97 gp10 family phage protein
MDSFNHFAQLAAAFEQGTHEGAEQVAQRARDHIKEWIQANGQVRTGTMLESVVAEGDTVMVQAPYAVYQNYGTRFLPARPFFELGLEQTASEMEQLLAEAIQAALGGA